MAIESKYSSFRLNKPYLNSYGLLDFIGDIFSSSTDEDIAQRNLRYQRERNAIEDARYEEETAYNRAFAEDERAYQRAFAEDEREYQRALQQQIFEREDTALERQASSLSAMGINPASVQMNGLGSGQALSPSSAGAGASAPVESSRGGQALHDDYKPSDTFSKLMTPILSFANTINNLNTAGFQRDILRAQADGQRLKNQEQQIINDRLQNKLDTEQEQREEDLRHNKKINPDIERDKKADANRNQREDEFQDKYGVQDGSYWITRQAADTANQLDRASQYVQDKVGDVSDSAINALADKAKEGIKKYDEATKKAQDWIVDKFRKGKNWLKNHTATPEQVRDMYGF